MEKSSRITWINGLKGIACVIVALHHYFMTFYPAICYGEEAGSKTASGIDILLSHEPYGVIFNGSFAVAIFILLSAFLFAGKGIRVVRNNEKPELLKLALGRYLKLMLPVAVVGLVYYILLIVLSALNLNYIQISSELNFGELILHILLLQWVTIDPYVLGPLWCMCILFLGSFIAYFLGLLSKKKYWFMPIVYIVIIAAYLYINLSYLNNTLIYYFPVLSGALLADIYYNDRLKWLKTIPQNIIGCVLIIAGIILGGYPTYAAPEFIMYKAIAVISNVPDFSHVLGAAILVLGIMMLSKTRFLSSKPLSFLGDISFGIYLIHHIIITFIAYYLVDVFTSSIGYAPAVCLTFVIYAGILVGLSVLFKKFIFDKFNSLVNSLLSKL